MPQHAAQHAGKIKTDARIDLNLVYTRKVIFHRVFYRNQFAVDALTRMLGPTHEMCIAAPAK
jgi:hypothetical protein